MTHRRLAFGLMVPVAAVLLAACNLPRQPSPQEIASTAAAQTVSAQLTQVSAATPTLPATNTPVPPPATNTPTPPPPPPPTATLGCSDNSQYVSDVTVPDNTNMAAGQNFTKTWRLRNSGSCTWTTAYDAVFVDGNAMGGQAAVPLAGPVPPNSTVDISVSLSAPSTNGTYRGNYRMRNDKDVIFGTLFYLQIVVGPTPTPTVGVYKTGSLTVNSSFTVDLDQITSPGTPNEDLWYEAVSAVERYLTPKNGATFKEMSGTPSQGDCTGASLSSAKINFTDIAVGDWFCYKTNASRYGRFQVDEVTASSITLDVRTWG